MRTLKTLAHEAQMLDELFGQGYWDSIVRSSNVDNVIRAMRAERARCARIVADRVEGGDDTKNRPHVSDVGLSEIIREIEGENR